MLNSTQNNLTSFFCSKHKCHTNNYNMLDNPFMPYFCPCNCDKIFPFYSYQLHKYGIHGGPHKLLASYVKNKQKCIIINKIKSDWCENNYGVYQGRVSLIPYLYQ